jgi:hypothetical protein
MIVDGADNATFSVFQTTEEEFAILFPASGQDIAFIEEVVERLGDAATGAALNPMWERPILRRDAMGLHGLLIYDGEGRRPFYPASGREMDFEQSAVNTAQRELFARKRSEA